MYFCQSQEDEGRPPMSQRTVSRDSLHELFDDGMDRPVRLGKPPASPASVAKLERKVGKLLARVRHFEARERAFLERHDELKSTLDALDAGRGAAAEAQARAAAKYDAWREEKAAHAASARVAAEKNAELVQHRKGLWRTTLDDTTGHTERARDAALEKAEESERKVRDSAILKLGDLAAALRGPAGAYGADARALALSTRLERCLDVAHLEDISEDELKCSVCEVAPRTVAIFDCGHLCLCANCAGGVDACPVCRQNARETRSVYLG
ncbi:hypothetical protein JL722_10085 [Aureococcus anophagefferens]|nr:hypothetical protein JL722_10085 [Aureococcus anophagefferens]